MSVHSLIKLKSLLHDIGEDETNVILSDFSCPVNKDVESFLKRTATNFDKQGISSTHLIFTATGPETVLSAYFTLANKCIDIPAKNLSSNMRKKVSRFSPRSGSLDIFHIALPLIAQLGKNYANKYNALISGNDVLSMAIDTIHEAQQIIGGRFAFLECEDTPKLKDFYKSNGFMEFNDRLQDYDDTDVTTGSKFIQMMRYI